MNKIAYLDGETYEIEAGETLLNFIERQREKGCVPTLCYDDRLEPFGEGNPSPVLLACNCRLAEPARASRDGKHLILKLRDGGTVMRAMGFFQGDRIDELQMGEDLHIAFTPVWNEFRGERNQELRVLDFAVGKMPPLEVQGGVNAMK